MERAHQAIPSASVRARPHPVYFAGAAGWVAFVALATTLVILHNELSPAQNWAALGWGVLAASSGVVGPAMRWLRTSIELDADGARWTTGILWRSTIDVTYEDMREMAIEQGRLGRQLGYAYVHIVDDAGTTHVLPPVGDVAVWRAAVSRRERPATSRRG
jgi:membrane protein YdbS with pleckstrin-like domain